MSRGDWVEISSSALTQAEQPGRVACGSGAHPFGDEVPDRLFVGVHRKAPPDVHGGLAIPARRRMAVIATGEPSRADGGCRRRTDQIRRWAYSPSGDAPAATLLEHHGPGRRVAEMSDASRREVNAP